jgi:hypothetical protein
MGIHVTVLFIVVKWQSVYDVQKVQILLPGLCVNVSKLVRNYGPKMWRLLRKQTPTLVEADIPFPNT